MKDDTHFSDITLIEQKGPCSLMHFSGTCCYKSNDATLRIQLMMVMTSLNTYNVDAASWIELKFKNNLTANYKPFHNFWQTTFGGCHSDTVILPVSMDIDEGNQPVEQGRKPKGLRVRGEPSESERKLHEKTHLPFRAWCKHCIMAKGGHAASRKLKDRQPVIQVELLHAH